ncbi:MULTISPECIES: NAD-dependent epimerase/dehydratase family protein [Desulfobacula]|uniref:UDP-glucose 4-epimerase n=2 Tax=Desulfobacula TaxID=28222 RepID=K0NI73_DESTT|nr:MULTISPECIES: NAD-dependent epimerase/dehydratase family protein [Desulfobacula]CCK78672.1 sugar dehydratase, associated with anaerobic toluene degradation [Desulfobacula toluolica Tol2]SDT88295.1 NAD dependent epimerase/dehydratase family protein [Desulfobacula phenolica]
MTKNILIIGGSYFAGRSLVEHLVVQKDVTLFTFNRGNIPLNISRVTQLHGDRTDSQSIKDNIPTMDWDVLIDFCGYAPDDIKKVIQSVPGNIKQYIFISSASVYDHSSILPLDETTRTIETPQPELGEYAEYGLNKIKAEQLLEKECLNRSISWTILRPSIVYGKFNYAPRENYFFDLLEKAEPVILPENNLALFNFIFVDDLAKIIIKCIENPSARNQVFNTVSHEYFSYDTYVAMLEKVINKKIKTVAMSVDKIVQGRIPLPFPIDQHQVYSGAKLNKAIGFEFISLFEGMKRTYEFHQFLMESKRGQ